MLLRRAPVYNTIDAKKYIRPDKKSQKARVSRVVVLDDDGRISCNNNTKSNIDDVGNKGKK